MICFFSVDHTVQSSVMKLGPANRPFFKNAIFVRIVPTLLFKKNDVPLDKKVLSAD